jgi:hypothetical protein
MATKKVRCEYCGGLGYHGMYSQAERREVRSPCGGGCYGTGWKEVQVRDTGSSGCVLFFLVTSLSGAAAITIIRSLFG